MEKRKATESEEPGPSRALMSDTKRLKLLQLDHQLRQKGRQNSTDDTFGKVNPSTYSKHLAYWNVFLEKYDISIPFMTLCQLYQLNYKESFKSILLPHLSPAVRKHSIFMRNPSFYENAFYDDLYQRVQDKTLDIFVNKKASTSKDVATQTFQDCEGQVSDQGQPLPEMGPEGMNELLDRILPIITPPVNTNEVDAGSAEVSDLEKDLFLAIVEGYDGEDMSLAEIIEEASKLDVSSGISKEFIFMDGLPFHQKCWIAAFDKMLEYAGLNKLELGVAKAAYMLLRDHVKDKDRLKPSRDWSPHVTFAVKRATGCLYKILQETKGYANTVDLLHKKYCYEDRNVWLLSPFSEIVDELIFGEGILGEYVTPTDKQEQRKLKNKQNELWTEFVEQKLLHLRPAMDDSHSVAAVSGNPAGIKISLSCGDGQTVIIDKSIFTAAWENIQKDRKHVVQGAKNLFRQMFTEKECHENSPSGRKGNTPDSGVIGKLSQSKLKLLKCIMYFLDQTPFTLDFDWSALQSCVDSYSNDRKTEEFRTTPRGTPRSKRDHSLQDRIETTYRNELSCNYKRAIIKDRSNSNAL